MNSNKLNEQLEMLIKERKEKQRERKEIDTDYTDLKEIVKKCGITSLISLIVYTGIFTMMINGKFYALKGIALFFRPFVFFIFLGSFIVLLIKGFDLYTNLDFKYSKKLADKFKINSYSEQLRILDGAIIFLNIRISEIEDELYENGDFHQTSKQYDLLFDDFEPVELNLDQEPVKEQQTQKTIENKTVIKAEDMIKKVRKTEKTNSIENIFSGLDNLDDDEEELNSSEMWKNDAMKKYSKY